MTPAETAKLRKGARVLVRVGLHGTQIAVYLGRTSLMARETTGRVLVRKWLRHNKRWSKACPMWPSGILRKSSQAEFITCGAFEAPPAPAPAETRATP